MKCNGMAFSYGTYNFGTAWAFSDLEQSNLRPAAVWIKRIVLSNERTVTQRGKITYLPIYDNV